MKRRATRCRATWRCAATTTARSRTTAWCPTTCDARCERVAASGRRLVLVTGRELDDLRRVFPHLELFDRVVAENGALLYTPQTAEEQAAGRAAAAAVRRRAARRGVEPLSVGRAIVATWEPHETTVLEAIRELGLELQVIFNKGAVMVLPSGVNKATGLRRGAAVDWACRRTTPSASATPRTTTPSWRCCECAVAVANALPALKERPTSSPRGDHGAGVAELIDELIARRPAPSRSRLSARHRIAARHADGRAARWRSPRTRRRCSSPGTSGSGKSTVATALLERLRGAGLLSSASSIPRATTRDCAARGGRWARRRTPLSLDEVLQAAGAAGSNVVVNLLGVSLERPPGVLRGAAAAARRSCRLRTGRPHWLVVDEAHHMLGRELAAADRGARRRSSTA